MAGSAVLEDIVISIADGDAGYLWSWRSPIFGIGVIVEFWGAEGW